VHPVGVAALGFLEGVHQLRRIALTVLSHGRAGQPPRDPVSTRFRALHTHELPWDAGPRSIRELLEEEEAQVLLNLDGLTSASVDTTMGVVTQRWAPVQGALLGDSTATGLHAQMYMFGDPSCTPPVLWAVHPTPVEKAVLMPHIYHPNSHAVGGNVLALSQLASPRDPMDPCTLYASPRDHTQPIKASPRDPPPASSVFCEGLGTFIAASFNRPRKLDPLMFSTWLQGLGRGLHSTTAPWLVALYVEPADTMLRLYHESQARGLPPSRIAPFHHTTLGEYASRLSRADVALDTAAWGGEMTTLNLLWAGTPIITLPSDSMSNRFGKAAYGASNLHHQSFIVNSFKSFEDGLAVVVRV